MIAGVPRRNREFVFPPFPAVIIFWYWRFPNLGMPLNVTAFWIIARDIPIKIAAAAASADVMFLAGKLAKLVRYDWIFIAVIAILSFMVFTAYAHRRFARHRQTCAIFGACTITAWTVAFLACDQLDIGFDRFTLACAFVA